MSEVRDNRAAGRFELDVDGLIATVAYRRQGDRIVFTHTEVPEALGGRGIGGRLVRGALDAARAEGAKVVPQCAFVRHFIESNPVYGGLL